MSLISGFLENKRNPKKINYLFPELEPILKHTYGILCYQEQVMNSCIAIAGYHKEDSDGIRKVIGKKILSMLPIHRRWFIYGRKKIDKDHEGYEKEYKHDIPGGIKLGHNKQDLEKFFDSLEEFGRYSFAKSHAAAYAAIGAATAWLAYYYPTEYFSSILNYSQGNQNDMMKYTHHCRNIGINITPPDVNKSGLHFTPLISREIVYSLNIKDASKKVVAEIEKERSKSPFSSVINFLARTLFSIDRKTFRGLAATNSFSHIDKIPCSSLVAATDDIFDKIIPSAKKELGHNDDINEIENFIRNEIEKKNIIPTLAEYPSFVLLNFEKYYAGHYISGHPLARIQDKIDEIRENNSQHHVINFEDIDYDIDEETGSVTIHSDLKSGTKVKFVAIVDDIKIKSTKKKELMAIVHLEDLTRIIEGVVWPNKYAYLSENLKKNQIYIFDAVLKFNDDMAPSIIIEDINSLDNDYRSRIVINIKTPVDLNKFRNIKKINNINNGEKEITYIQYKKTLILLNKEDWITKNSTHYFKMHGELDVKIMKW